jgi:protein-L-isoaspartate(D-aspartate) O-methyltransferase
MTDSASSLPPIAPLPHPSSAVFTPEQFARCRDMVQKQIHARGIVDTRVLNAMLTVPRHAFVSADAVSAAYDDQPLAIGQGQTISQPFIVGSMTQALELTPQDCILEIGTGSGYQAAVLSLLSRVVHTIEMHPALAEEAAERLARLGYTNVHVHVGDGTVGWPREAPFGAILVAAGAPDVPRPLVEQLADGGRLIVPVGPAERQELVRVRRVGDSTTTESLYACRFVPLIGEYGWSSSASNV